MAETYTCTDPAKVAPEPTLDEMRAAIEAALRTPDHIGVNRNERTDRRDPWAAAGLAVVGRNGCRFSMLGGGGRWRDVYVPRVPATDE
jgi:transposase